MNIQNRFKRISCYLLSLAMVIPSNAQANPGGAPSSAGPITGSATTYQPTGQNTGGGNEGMMILQQLNNVGNAIQSTLAQVYAMQEFQNNMRTFQSLYPRPLPPQDMPGMMLPPMTAPACQILPARTPQLGPGSKCEPPMDPSKIGQYGALKEVAFQIANTYQNFGTDGNGKGGGSGSGQAYSGQGLSCYDRARANLEARLKGRLEAVKGLEKLIDEKIDRFQEMSSNDLQSIKRGKALLEGKPVELLKDVRFQDQFKDPQCRSFLTAQQISQEGQGGFRAIQKMLTQVVSTPQKGGMAPSELMARAGDIEKDIDQVAQQIARQMSRQNFAELKGIEGLHVTSRTNIHESSALKRIVQEQINTKKDEIDIMRREFSSAGADKRAQQIFEGVFGDRLNIDNAIANYEKDHKNTCLNGYLQSNFGGPGGLRQRLKDPNISKKANREADSSFKNYVEGILKNDSFTIEEKIAQIREFEKKGRNSRYTMTTGRSVDINGKSVGASARLKASDIIGIFVDNCSAKFESEPGPQGHSPREVINKLKDIQNRYNNYKNTFVSNVAGSIKKELLRCPSDTSTGSAANSCSSDRLNPSSASFCLKTAKACATNMNACLDKANTIVDKTRQEQIKIATRYNANVDRFKTDMLLAFKQTNAVMTQEARFLDTINEGYGTMFEAASNLDTNRRDPAALIKGLEDLQIEDPKKYAEKMKKNLAVLKKNIEKHNKEIIQGVKKEINNYKQNYQKMAQTWSEVAKDCMDRLVDYDGMMAQQQAEQTQQAQEYNEQLSVVCSSINSYNQDPSAACGEVGNLIDDMLATTATMGEGQAIAALRRHQNRCDSQNGGDQSNIFMATTNESEKNIPRVSPSEFCETNTIANSTDECQRYQHFMSDFHSKNGNTECIGSTEEYLAEASNQTNRSVNAKARKIAEELRRGDENSKEKRQQLREQLNEELGENSSGKKVVCRSAAGQPYRYQSFQECGTSDEERIANLISANSLSSLPEQEKDELLKSYLQNRAPAGVGGAKDGGKCYLPEMLSSSENYNNLLSDVNRLQNQYITSQQLSDIGPVRVPSCHGLNEEGRGIAGFGGPAGMGGLGQNPMFPGMQGSQY